MTRRNWIAAAILALAAAVPQLAAADYWRYETETGAVAFTDDPKGIPAKYQASARAVQEESLFDYSRLSVVDSDANRAPTRERVGRDEAAVPVFAWPVSQAPATTPRSEGASSRVRVNVNGMQVDVEGAEDGDEPLYVDRGQYFDMDGDYFDRRGITSPTTIIRRGDKPIAYIDER